MSQPPKSDRGAHPLEGISKDGVGVSFESRSPGFSSSEEEIEKLVELALWHKQYGDYEEYLRLEEKLAYLPSQSSPMGLSIAVNSHKLKEKAPRGQKGITSNGKRMVRSCAAVLEKRAGHHDVMTFGTLTLPNLSEDELLHVSSNWSELIRQFFQELRRLLKRRSLPTDYVQVTEIQEQCYLETGLVRLHAHFVYQGRQNRRSHWGIRPSEVKNLWGRLLENLLGHEVYREAATSIQRAKKSLAQELGKYLSKGGRLIQQIIQDGKAEYLPSDWWGAPLALKQSVKQQIQEYGGEVAGHIMDNLNYLERSGDITWFYKLEKEVSDSYTTWTSKICIGAVGGFKDAAYLARLVRGSPELLVA